MTASSTRRVQDVGRTVVARAHDGLDTRSRRSDKAVATAVLVAAWVLLVLLATALLH
ncbi:MAG: hypothetical protein ACXVFV_10175 [Mycobacteriales bacterium]